MKCLQCGANIPPREKSVGGNQPGFCSDECRKTRKRKTLRDWVAKNRERKLAVDARHRKRRKETHPDYFKQHYAKHREKRKREAQEWYRANAEYANERQKAYTATRPIERRRVLGRKNSATRRARTAQVFVEAIDARVVFERDGGICGICRLPVDVAGPWEVDHIVPIVRGGAHAYANVQLAHRRCNRSKSARLLMLDPLAG